MRHVADREDRHEAYNSGFDLDTPDDSTSLYTSVRKVTTTTTAFNVYGWIVRLEIDSQYACQP